MTPSWRRRLERRCSSVSYRSLIFPFLRSLHITAELLSEPGLSPNYLWAHKGFRSTLQRGARAELVGGFFFFPYVDRVIVGEMYHHAIKKKRLIGHSGTNGEGEIIFQWKRFRESLL